MYCVYYDTFVSSQKLDLSLKPFTSYGSISENIYVDLEKANNQAESYKNRLLERLKEFNINVKDVKFSDLNQNKYYYQIDLEDHAQPLFVYVHKFSEGDN